MTAAPGWAHQLRPHHLRPRTQRRALSLLPLPGGEPGGRNLGGGGPTADRDYFRELARTRQVTGVFFSHFHEDHQKYNHLFPQATFYGPLLEEEAFFSVDAVCRFMGITDPDFRDYWRRTLSQDFHFQPPAHLTPYFPGQLFQLGEVTLEIIPAPGHTPGAQLFPLPPTAGGVPGRRGPHPLWPVVRGRRLGF